MSDLEELAEVRRLDLGPTDIVVLTMRGNYPTDEVDRLFKIAAKAFPDNKVFIIDQDIDITVVRQTEDGLLLLGEIPVLP